MLRLIMYAYLIILHKPQVQVYTMQHYYFLVFMINFILYTLTKYLIKLFFLAYVIKIQFFFFFIYLIMSRPNVSYTLFNFLILICFCFAIIFNSNKEKKEWLRNGKCCTKMKVMLCYVNYLLACR